MGAPLWAITLLSPPKQTLTESLPISNMGTAGKRASDQVLTVQTELTFRSQRFAEYENRQRSGELLDLDPLKDT